MIKAKKLKITTTTNATTLKKRNAFYCISGPVSLEPKADAFLRSIGIDPTSTTVDRLDGDFDIVFIRPVEATKADDLRSMRKTLKQFQP